MSDYSDHEISNIADNTRDVVMRKLAREVLELRAKLREKERKK
jgi:hypothetical protein